MHGLNSETLPEPAVLTAQEFEAEVMCFLTCFLAGRGNEARPADDWHREFSEWVKPYTCDLGMSDA